MAFDLENIAKQLAALGPNTQAALFESLAKLTGHSSIKDLAEYYQQLLAQAESVNSATANESTVPKNYPLAAEAASRQSDRIGESSAVYGSAKPQIDTDYQEVYAFFDGEVLKPESKVDLDLNTRYRVFVEKPPSKFPEIKNRAFRRIAARAVPMGIKDFAEQHDHYLYGIPKK
jgi:hypothetical protein